jgi:exodeoxyribonuclease VII small subunit
MTVTKEQKGAINFEASLQELETIVERMEHGELSLEDALKQFEKGIKLTQQCQQALEKAEQKVKILIEKNNSLELENYQEP